MLDPESGTVWILRSTSGRILQLPDGTDEVGARRYAAQWTSEIGQPVEVWYSVDDGPPQRLMDQAATRVCDVLCRDVENDRDRLYGLLGDVAGALEIALRLNTGEEREGCRRVLARAREALA